MNNLSYLKPPWNHRLPSIGFVLYNLDFPVEFVGQDSSSMSRDISLAGTFQCGSMHFGSGGRRTSALHIDKTKSSVLLDFLQRLQ